MASNNNVSNNVRNSKTTTPEEQNAIRRAKKKLQKPGNNSSTLHRHTTHTLLKTFDPTTFSVRSKAVALLDSPYKEQMVAAFGKFFTMNTDDAFNLIWELTYQHEETKSHLLKVLGLSPEMVPNLSLLLVELAAQYRAYVNREFMLSPDLIDEVMPAFDAIFNRDRATALFVYNMCTNYLIINHDDQINKNLDRLGSNAANRIHGGILDLIKAVDIPDKDSRYALSAYLKPWYMEIHNLLKAMADAKVALEKNASFSTAPALANLADACMAAGYTLADENPIVVENADNPVAIDDLPFTMDSPDEAEAKKTVKELTLDNILEYGEAFVEFINNNSAQHLLELHLAGFEIGKLYAKKEVIAEILEHHAKMIKAAEALTK